jgi:hypothetical protein
VDFGGNTGGIVASLIQSVLKANKENGQALVDKIINSGAEMTMQFKGYVSFNLNDLKNGFLPYLAVDLGTTFAVVTSGADNCLGIKPGVYVLLQSNAINNLLSLINFVNDQFSPIMKMLNIPLLQPLTYSTISLGIFIQDEAMASNFMG